MKTTKPMLEYLATCSKISLQSFELARLNDCANLRKDMIELLDEIIEVDSQARVAEWILAHRSRQTEERPPRRVCANSSGASQADSLPLFSSENQTESQLETHNDRDALALPALEANSLFPSSREEALDPSARLRRSSAPISEKSKRIA